MSNVVGTRHRCERCGSVLIVTHAGAGSLECCGQPMTLVGGAATAAQGS